MIVFLVAVWQGCSNKQDSASFDRIFDRLSRTKSYDQMRQYYTSDTIAAIEDAVSHGIVSEKEKLTVLPKFNEKMKWEEVSKKANSSRGIIRIRYTDHPVQNMVGFTMDFKLHKEKGSWRIDLADEIRAAMQSRKNHNAAEYIKHIKKRY